MFVGRIEDIGGYKLSSLDRCVNKKVPERRLDAGMFAPIRGSGTYDKEEYEKRASFKVVPEGERAPRDVRCVAAADINKLRDSLASDKRRHGLSRISFRRGILA